LLTLCLATPGFEIGTRQKLSNKKVIFFKDGVSMNLLHRRKMNSLLIVGFAFAPFLVYNQDTFLLSLIQGKTGC